MGFEKMYFNDEMNNCIICHERQSGKDLIKHILIRHQLIRAFRPNPGENLRCTNKNCRSSNVTFKPDIIYQYATHILMKCNNANPMNFLRQGAIQKIKWQDLNKVYKIQNTKVITDTRFDKPKMGQINKEKSLQSFILEQTNKTLIGTDVQTNEICLGVSSGMDRSCKIEHQQNEFVHNNRK